MKNSFYKDKDFDFSKVDLTKVPLSQLDYYCRNASIKQLCTAVCKILKQMGILKDEEQATKDKLSKSTGIIGNNCLNRIKDNPNFCIGHLVEEQDLNLVDKVVLNYKLKQLDNQRELNKSTNYIDTIDTANQTEILWSDESNVLEKDNNI